MTNQAFRKAKILVHLLVQAFRDWKENVSRKDLDSVYCCDGRECGCGAITIGEAYGEKEYV